MDVLLIRGNDMKVATFIETGKMEVTEFPMPVIEKETDAITSALVQVNLKNLLQIKNIKL